MAGRLLVGGAGIFCRGGRLRIIAALTDSASIRTYLEGLGLPAVPPPRAPPQPQFEFVA